MLNILGALFLMLFNFISVEIFPAFHQTISFYFFALICKMLHNILISHLIIRKFTTLDRTSLKREFKQHVFKFQVCSDKILVLVAGGTFIVSKLNYTATAVHWLAV